MCACGPEQDEITLKGHSTEMVVSIGLARVNTCVRALRRLVQLWIGSSFLLEHTRRSIVYVVSHRRTRWCGIVFACLSPRGTFFYHPAMQSVLASRPCVCFAIFSCNRSLCTHVCSGACAYIFGLRTQALLHSNACTIPRITSSECANHAHEAIAMQQYYVGATSW